MKSCHIFTSESNEAYNNTRTMKNQIIFKKGQAVKIKGHMNASDFNMGGEWSCLGAYQIKDWQIKEFEIEGTVKLITFKHSPEVYGAYLLKHNAINVGYVYNCGIEAI